MIRISVITSLFHCHQYLDGYFKAVEEIVNKEECEFLLLFNDPTSDEEEIVRKYIENKSYFKYIRIARESLYATWNRGIHLAQGEYIANWNVDDCREPDSLKRQADALDRHPECAVAYGDTISVLNFGDKKGRRNVERSFTTKSSPLFKHSFFMSCFPMWRKSIHNQVGYYDEQFKLVGDFEFQVRMAYFYDFIKVDGILGYFLSGGGGTRLSQQISTHSIEDNLVYMRYGAFFKVNLLCLKRTIKERSVYTIFNGKERIPIEKYLPNLRQENKGKRFLWLINLAQKFPIDLLRYIKINIFKIPTRTL